MGRCVERKTLEIYIHMYMCGFRWGFFFFPSWACLCADNEVGWRALTCITTTAKTKQGGKNMTVRLVKGPITGDGNEECDARLQGAWRWVHG